MQSNATMSVIIRQELVCQLEIVDMHALEVEIWK